MFTRFGFHIQSLHFLFLLFHLSILFFLRFLRPFHTSLEIVLQELESKFAVFMKTLAVSNPEKAEFFLPFAVDELLHEGKATVKVLRSGDKWYGVTYAADKPQVVAALRAMAEEGKYPDGLWG